MARSTHASNWSSSSTPSGSTATQFRISLPVMSNARTCGCRSAASPSSGPRRAMSRSFQTPTSALPLMKKQMQPNIFFASTFLRRARASRIRAARDSSKAIVLLLQQRGPVILIEHPREAHGVHAVDQGVGTVFMLVGPLLVRDRDVPEERRLLPLDLKGELPVRPDERQQEEGVLPRRPGDGGMRPCDRVMAVEVEGVEQWQPGHVVQAAGVALRAFG